MLLKYERAYSGNGSAGEDGGLYVTEMGGGTGGNNRS